MFLVGSHSGRVRLLGEQLGLNGSPGFESLSHRQQKITLILDLFFAGGAFWLKSELFLTKIRTANFDAPPSRRSLTLATPQKSFLYIFYFARPIFFLKGKENFFAGLCSERAGRRVRSLSACWRTSARARRNSPHTQYEKIKQDVALWYGEGRRCGMLTPDLSHLRLKGDCNVSFTFTTMN